jgi:hypothetical protein
MAEISESPHRPVDAASLVQNTLRAMAEDRLIDPARHSIRTTVARRIPRAYPTPFLDRDSVLDPILARFEEREIYSRGRFGAWKYEVSNQDHAFAQGRECAQRLLANGGRELEPTLWKPNWVNSRRNP